MREGYITVYINSIVAGAELGGIVHDQWVNIRFRDLELCLFDQDVICPDCRVGQYLKMKMGVMPVKVEIVEDNPRFLDNRHFIGIVVEVFPREEGSTYLVDVGGLLLHLDSSMEFSKGTTLRIDGRLDLIALESSEQSGWRSVRP